MAARRTRREIEVDRRDQEIRRAIGTELRHQREDAGVNQSQLARAADLSPGFMSRIEAGSVAPSLRTYVSIAHALGGDVWLRYAPGAGVPLRDRYQARMIEALLRILHPRWRRFTEVVVRRPVRGVVDLVLHDPDANEVVATEAHSLIRRLEQQQRWAALKSEALLGGSELPLVQPGSPRPNVSRLLLLRATAPNRRLLDEFAETVRAAYPADSAAAYDALTGIAPWPGPAVIWVRVRGSVAEVLRGAPTGRRRA